MTKKAHLMEYATDFDCGIIYEGKVCGSVLTERKHIKFLIVELAIKLFLNHDERLLSQTISPRQKNNKLVRMRKPFKKALKELSIE